MKKTVLIIVVMIALVVGIYTTQVKIDAFKARDAKYYVEKNLLIALPTNMIKYVTLGFDQQLADIAWLQFIQYFGENSKILRSGGTKYDFSYTYKYIDVITTLDPHFSYAYWFGAFAIADEMKEPDLAMKVIKKGVEENPDNWWLPYAASIMELMYFNNMPEAARYADIAYKLNPKRVKNFRNVLKSRAKIQEKNRQIWLQIYTDARDRGDEMTMQRAEEKLKKLGYRIKLNTES